MDKLREIKKLNEDKVKSKEKQNFKDVISVCNYLGVLYLEQGEYDKAIEQHKEELAYGRKLNDDLSIAVAFRKLGECYLELNEFENALNFHCKYLSIAEKLNDTIEIQRAYATLGRTYFMQYIADSENNSQSLEQSETAHLKALILTDSLKDLKDKLNERDWAEMRCRALLNLGLIYEQKDDEEQCSSHFKRAINLAAKFGFKEDLHRCEVSLAAFYSKIGDYVQAIKMYDSAIRTAKQLKDKLDLFETLMGKAYTLVKQRDYENSRHCFKKAYFIYKEECDENFEAKKCYNSIKQIIIKVRELTNTTSIKDKIDISDKLGDLFCDLNCYSIALEYYNEELRLALDYYEENTSRLSDNEIKKRLAPIYLSLGQTYLDNKQYIEALSYFKKEIECQSSQNKIKEVILTNFKVIEAKCCLYRNDDEIINEYDRLIVLCGNDNRLKLIVYREYVAFWERIEKSNNQLYELYTDKIERINSKYKDLKRADRNDEQIFNSQSSDNSQSNDTENNLSDVSDLTSDSETEENEALNENRRKRRQKKEKRNEKGETQLHRACIEGNTNLVEKLIEEGNNINPRDNCGWLPIHEASNHGYAEIVKLLIKHKAWINDPGGRGCDGTTPLHDACTNGHIEVIRLLLKADANVICFDYHNKTPLDCLEQYLERSNELTDREKEDFDLLVEEMKEKMEKRGFKSSIKKTLKRPFSSIEKLNSNAEQDQLLENLSNKINKNRSKRSRILESPPRKTNRLNQHPNNLRKNIDHSVDQVNDNRKFQRINSLIDEENLIVDDWLEDDLGLNNKKSKTINDPFATKKQQQKSYTNEPQHHRSPIKSTPRSLEHVNDENSSSSVSCIFDSDIELDNECSSNKFEVILNEENLSNSSVDDCQPVYTTNKVMNKKIKRKQTKIKNYFSLNDPTLKSTSDKKDDVILVNNNVTRCDSTKVSTLESNKITNKLKVRVHIDGMTLLVPLSNENVSIGWLMNETVERYYSFKKIRPVIQLKTMDGALLSNDDQIVDVLTNMEVNVEIDSFNIKPIDELYNEFCRNENLKVVNELDYEFRISMASGCLNLRNCYLEDVQFRLLTNSLKMQSRIKVLDLSYSNLMKLDDNFNLIKIIFNLSNLEVLNLECTGLSRQHLIEFAKLKTTKLIDLNLNYNLLLNSVDLICDLIENNCNLIKLSLQYTDLTEQLILNLRLNQLIEKRVHFQIHIDALKNSKNYISSSFVASSLNVPELTEFDYQEFNKQLFIS